MSDSNSGGWLPYVQAGMDLGAGIYGIINNERAFKYQQEIDQFNKDMAEKNYQLAVDQMDWQHTAQQTAWSREDNAIQRRVADLEAAGMSKWLAAGQAAQAGGVTASNVTSGSNMINSGANLKDVNLKNSVDSFLVGAERQAGISLTEKQQELVQAQIDNEKADTINKTFTADKIVAETQKIYQETQNSIEQIGLLVNQFNEQKKVWESEKNKNSAVAMQARQQAEVLQVQALSEMSRLNMLNTYFEMDIEKHEDSLKNSKNQRVINIFGETRKWLRDISNILNTWLPGGSGSSPIGFSFD